MRASALLISVVVHGAAVTAAAGLGWFVSDALSPPPARIELRPQVASAPAQPRAVPPDVVAEQSEFAPLPELVDSAEPLPSVDERPLPGDRLLRPRYSPTLERICKAAKRPVPPEPHAADVQEPAEQQPPAAAAPPQSDVEAAPCEQNEPPRYPDAERRRAREGVVVVRVRVGPDGAVQQVALREPSRYPAFNREALRAVRGWRFRPGTRHGVPVVSETDVEVVFRLTD